MEKPSLKIYQQIFPFLCLSARVNYLLFHKKSVCKNILMSSFFHGLFSLHPTVMGFPWDLVQDFSGFLPLEVSIDEVCVPLATLVDPLSGDCFNRQYVSLKAEGFPGYVQIISTQVGQGHFHFTSGFVENRCLSSLPVLFPMFHQSLGKGPVLLLLRLCCSLVVLPGICKFAYIVVVLG